MSEQKFFQPDVLIINPPLVQLNTPYPSGAYLSDFFKKQNCNTHWYDLSIELYYEIFSKSGLEKIFAQTSKKALLMAQNAQNQGDLSTAFNLRRYVQNSAAWINWIDTINQLLTQKNYEKSHEFLYSPFAPRGNRMENFLASLEHEPTVDDIHFLCSYAIADLADYITAVYDSNFSLIRYAEKVVSEQPDFSAIQQQLESPVIKDFYIPLLKKFFQQGGESSSAGSSTGLPLAPTAVVAAPSRASGSATTAFSATPSNRGSAPVTPPTLVLISVPFAGTFVPALATAKYLKELYQNNVYIFLGGGYVNTELRDFTNPEISKYVDALSFDRGYGSYKAFLENPESKESLYKLRRFNPYSDAAWENQKYSQFEDEITAQIVPDYTDIDFSKYLKVCDDKNPMHRLWTDGTWLKAYLAHGCYWHKCAFCDTKLDYVCAYKVVDTKNLFYGLEKTAEQKNVFGIHFVDEALPPVALKDFALLNAKRKALGKTPLYFWGNIRFEKAFTKDLAAFLAYCGFGAVSAGIEVATGQGLKNINKGTDISSIVSACAAFKEAGILVHAYMIYGFWYDTPQTIIDSMETLRQFFECGLLDSAFWHQFMLTKNSELYEQLKNTFTPKAAQKYEKYGLALDTAVNSWMHGEKLEMKVQKWFDFTVPSPTIPRDFIEKQIEKYEETSNQKIKEEKIDSIYWLASSPIMFKNENGQNTLSWIYLQEECSMELPKTCELFNCYEILNCLVPGIDESLRNNALLKIKKSPKLFNELQRFHNQGLVCI